MRQLYTSRVGRVVAPGKCDFFERPVYEPQGNQVVIQVRASALCGSDLHIFQGKHPSVTLPCTIGHEFSGDVVATGPDVRRIRIGDRVTVEPCVVCGECEACRTGHYGYCENISFTYRDGNGSMADYVTVKEPSVFLLPDTLSYDAGCLIEPLAVATHAVRRAAVGLHDRVLVLGAGAIGLLIAAVCHISGAAETTAVDYAPARLQQALRLGADHTINPAEESVEAAIQKMTNGRGVDKTFECVGVEATFLQAMTALRKDGLATIVGIYEKPNVTIPASVFVTREIHVQGAQGYCWDFPVALDLAGKIDLPQLITHTFALNELQTALETGMNRGSGSIKIVIHPQEKGRSI